MNNRLLQKLEEAPIDNNLYLLEKLTENAGFFANEGNLIYMVRNNEQCSDRNISTDYIKMNTNIKVVPDKNENSTFLEDFYNILRLCKDKDSYNNQDLCSFVDLCRAHANYLNGENFTDFFDSLVSLFQLPREEEYKNLLGFVGELFFIKKIFEKYNIDISSYWHTSGIYSKFDIVLPDKNIEIKTAKNSNDVAIKHEQIFSNSINNYLVSVNISEDNSGITLNELVCEFKNNNQFSSNLKFLINIETEIKKVSPKDAAERKFILNNYKTFHAATINPFPAIPKNVKNLNYTLETSSLIQLSQVEEKNILKF